jgi:hypothetical protein
MIYTKLRTDVMQVVAHETRMRRGTTGGYPTLADRTKMAIDNMQRLAGAIVLAAPRTVDGKPCWCINFTEAPHEGWVHSPTCTLIGDLLDKAGNS